MERIKQEQSEPVFWNTNKLLCNNWVFYIRSRYRYRCRDINTENDRSNTEIIQNILAQSFLTSKSIHFGQFKTFVAVQVVQQLVGINARKNYLEEKSSNIFNCIHNDSFWKFSFYNRCCRFDSSKSISSRWILTLFEIQIKMTFLFKVIHFLMSKIKDARF